MSAERGVEALSSDAESVRGAIEVLEVRLEQLGERVEQLERETPRGLLKRAKTSLLNASQNLAAGAKRNRRRIENGLAAAALAGLVAFVSFTPEGMGFVEGIAGVQFLTAEIVELPQFKDGTLRGGDSYTEREHSAFFGSDYLARYTLGGRDATRWDWGRVGNRDGFGLDEVFSEGGPNFALRVEQPRTPFDVAAFLAETYQQGGWGVGLVRDPDYPAVTLVRTLRTSADKQP